MMRTNDLLSLSTRMFKTRPMRTMLTILGVSVGIGTVLFLVSLGYGLQNVILERIATADSLLTLDVSPGPAGTADLSESGITLIQSLPHIAEVSRQKNYSAQITINDLTGNVALSAVDASFLRLRGITPHWGKGFSDTDTGGVLLSSAAVQLFNLKPADILGQAVHVTLFLSQKGTDGQESPQSVDRITPYTVTGVIDDESTSYADIALPSLRDLSITSYDQVKVKVESSGFLEAGRDALIARGFVVSALSDLIDQANKVFQVVQIVLALFGLVALIVSAIGMFNTMTITLLERINEIGIMRAIGITRGDILRLFLLESILMGFLGGLVGVLLGVGAGLVANAGINALAVRFGGSAIPIFQFPVWFVTVILVFSTLIGFLTGIYPSRRASKINPLDALRYK